MGSWACLSLLLRCMSGSLTLVGLQGSCMQQRHLPQLLLQLLALSPGTAAGLLGVGKLPVLLPAADCQPGCVLLLPLHLLPACPPCDEGTPADVMTDAFAMQGCAKVR